MNPAAPILNGPPLDPWKSLGYPELTRWMASSNDFVVVRKFTPLAVRALLLLQDDIARLERDISRMDEFSKSQPPGKGGTGSFRIDREEAKHGSPREATTREAVEKLKEYYAFLNLFSTVKSRPGAQDHQISNVANWFHNNDTAIDQDETCFIQSEGDLIALVPKQRSLLRHGLEQIPSIRNLFRVRHRADRIQSTTTSYASDRGMDLWTSVFIVVVGLAMLLGPMWALQLTNGAHKKLTIISVFVIVLSTLMFGSTASATRGFEVLAATAAYAAVLAVFLQINNHIS